MTIHKDIPLLEKGLQSTVRSGSVVADTPTKAAVQSYTGCRQPPCLISLLLYL